MFELFPSRAVAFSLFGFDIHWYGILYLLAFVLAGILLPKLQRYRGLQWTGERWSGVLVAAVLGVIVGGRFGYALLYEPAYFFAHPWEILAVWQGGMSSHGGFIGVPLAIAWTLRKQRDAWLAVADTAVVPIALGLALGRFGNFINQELYGTVTTLSWGIAIPGVEGLRHPIPLYAIGKNLLIATVCFWHLRKTSIPGRTFAIFLLLYGALRFMLEFIREPTHSLVDLGVLTLTRGQLFTIPLLLVGGALYVWAGRRMHSPGSKTAL